MITWRARKNDQVLSTLNDINILKQKGMTRDMIVPIEITVAMVSIKSKSSRDSNYLGTRKGFVV